MGAIGNCHPAGAPEPWQGKACKGVDQIGRCGFEFWCVDMLSVDPPQRLGGSDARGMSGGLAGSEIAAVAEHCENIALFWPGKFGVCAGGWPEVASVAGPACAVFDKVEQVAVPACERGLPSRKRPSRRAGRWCMNTVWVASPPRLRA